MRFLGFGFIVLLVTVGLMSRAISERNDTIKLLKHEVANPPVCELRTCADPRADWTQKQKEVAEKYCNEPGACARRQLFVHGDDIIPLTALTEVWSEGELRCK